MDVERSNLRVSIRETILLETSRSYFTFYDLRTLINLQVFMPLEYRTFEEKIRHMHGALIPLHFESEPVRDHSVIPDRHFLFPFVVGR